ncbi:alpha-2-macroglobulin family protein [Capnocytophaga canimorsus]|uniref:alpha-2-macroglobulin family protein n=1 Tax=Capnocytophaga canimorsus TaxID=28188 RepID=UPI0037D256E2
MKKIALFLVAFVVLVGCNRGGKGSGNSDPLLYKEYISAFTGGIISSAEPIEITFNKEISEEKLKKISDLKLFEISPKVKGEVVAVSSTKLQFRPEKRLEQAQEYQITFHLAKLFSVAENLEEFRFSAKTMEQVFSMYGFDLQSYNENLFFLNANFMATDEVSGAEAKNFFVAKIGNKNYPIKFAQEGTGRVFSFVVDSIQRTSEEQTLKLLWNTDWVKTDDAEAHSVIIPANGDFSVISTFNPSDTNKEYWINFSEPLDKNQNFNGLVILKNTKTQAFASLSFGVNGNVLKLFTDSPLIGDYQLTVHQGIKSVYGKRLNESQDFEVSFLESKPKVELLRNGTILPSSENLKINFKAINLRAVDATVYRIFENNVLQFLQDNDLSSATSLLRVGRPIAKKVIVLNNGSAQNSKQWSTYALDLSSLITPEPGAIYRVELDFKRNYSLYQCGEELKPLDLSFNEEPLEKDNYFSHYDDYDYYWDDSDDPCEEAYYYGKQVATNILASDLGVIVKRGQTNNFIFAVNNIINTEPVHGANVEVYDYQQQKIQEGRTDNKGLVSLNLSRNAYFAVVKKDANTTYVKIDNNYAQSVSKYDVDGVRLQKGLNGYIYTERGVWRPGDSIHVGFVLNDFASKSPEKLPIKLVFTDPHGKVITERMQPSNASNHYKFSLKTSPQAPTGNWNVSIAVGAARFGKQIKIETIKPNRLKIENSLNGKQISSEGGRGSLAVKWLHGSPAGNTQVDVKAKLYNMKTTFKGYEKFIFNNEAQRYESEEISIYSGKTDAQGNADFVFENEEFNSPGMLKVNFLTKANESGGDFSTDVSSATLSPYESYVGISLPTPNKYNYYNTNEKHNFQTVVVSENGKPLRNKKIQVTVYKTGWNWWWDASNQNISTYSSSRSNIVYTSQQIHTNSDGKAQFELNIPDGDWGKYFILLTDQSSGHHAGTSIYFDWGDWYGKSRETSNNEQATMLTLGMDKQEYGVNEKARLFFPSDKGGRAFISIENGSEVLETHWVETAEKETTFELSVTNKMAPNVYAYVTYLQPHINTKNDAPIRLYGILPIAVVDKATKLEPQIQMAEVLRPEQKTTIKVSEKSGKAMTYTLAIVEDGLLNLTRFKTPNPWNSFFAKTALGVKTWDVYNDVIGAYGGTINQVLSIGGDEDLGGSEAQKANRFKPFVIFKGPFELKAGKTDAHEVQIPNYIGSARVMVIASQVSENAYGFAEKTEVPVRSPLMVLGSLPRKAVPGEKITLLVTVFAMENHVKNVSISVESNNHFKVVSNRSQSLRFDNPSEKMAYFELETTAQTGIGKVKIVATSGNEKATYEVEMDVYNPNPVTYVVENATISAGQKVDLKAALFGESGSNQTVLEISSFPGVNLHQRLNYLITYPHGCLEQVTSGAFPQLFIGDFVKMEDEKAQQIQRNVTVAIAKLFENQLSDGGFAYWKGNRYADDWGTSYVGHFFIEAEKKGFALPSGSKSKWLNYQKSEARQWRFKPEYGNDFAQAYRLYTLALAGSADLAAMNRLRETADISANAKRLLAAAYAVSGHKKTAGALFQNTSLDGNYYYGSEVRNKAMALETALLIDKKTDANRWALEIAEKLSSSEWMSTQTTAYALYAMAKYVQINKSGKSFNASYTLNGKTEKLSSSQAMLSKELNVKGENASLQVKNDSEQTLFVKLISSGVLPVGKELAMENGLSVSTSYKNASGNTINETEVVQGTEIWATISIKNITNERVENVALTQIIPSGWEIINTRYADFDNTEAPLIDYADFRDDRANFYMSLKAGETKKIVLKLHASYAGAYYLPGTFAEAMYDNRYNTRTSGKRVTVK